MSDDDKIVLMNADDFERLAKDAVPAKEPLLGGLEIVKDRFGVVPAGSYFETRDPPVRNVWHPFSHDHDAFDYAFPSVSIQMLPPTRFMYIGMDWGFADDNILSPREVWATAWRWSSRRTRERMQRRLDRRSNVRRAKRYRELQRRNRA